MDPTLALAIPGGTVAFGLICLAINKVSIWRFDRKHPHLSRNGMRALARQAQLRPSALHPTRRAAMATAASDLSEARRQEAITEGEVAELENTLGHFGRNVTHDLDRRRKEPSAA